MFYLNGNKRQPHEMAKLILILSKYIFIGIFYERSPTRYVYLDILLKPFLQSQNLYKGNIPKMFFVEQEYS